MGVAATTATLSAILATLPQRIGCCGPNLRRAHCVAGDLNMAKSTSPGGQSPENPQPIRPMTNGSSTDGPNPQPTPLAQSASEVPSIEQLNLEDFRVDQNFDQHVATVRKKLSIPVGRPSDQEWIFLHPSA